MLIIFDCDGVLIDSERILNRVLRECLAGFGLHLSLEETIQHFKGRSTQACLALAEQLLGAPLPVAEITAQYKRLGAECFRTELKPIPGIAEALDRLPQRRCVASNSSHEHIRTGLELTGLMPYFKQEIFSASDVSRSKPAPDLFLHAAQQMGADPSECIVIEDSTAGIEAAIAAKMRVLGYVDLSPDHELRKAGAQTFYDMAELPDLIHSIMQ